MAPSSKADRNTVIAVFQELATLLNLAGANPFRVRAFENGARVLEAYSGDLVEDLKSGELAKTRGIGKGLLGEIEALVKTGKSPLREDLLAEIPPGLLDLLRVPGLGAKRVKQLYDTLGIETIEQLEAACTEERIAPLKGFGKRSQEKFLEGITFARRRLGRHGLAKVWALADTLLEAVQSCPAVIRCSVAGSIRRRSESIKDIDLLVASDDAEAVFDVFVALDEVDEVLLRGETKTSLRLVEEGIQVDIRVVTDEEYPFALHYFTGSKEHNTVLRGRAREQGLKLNEYGLFPEDSEVSRKCPDEAEIFRTLGLEYVPPELRENLGEIEMAEKGELPVLLDESDILGGVVALGDGAGEVVDTAKAASKAGWKWLGLVAPWNEGPSATVGGQASLRKKLVLAASDLQVFLGVEVDILPDGTLDLDEAAGDDAVQFTLARVHGALGLPRARQTERLCRATVDPRLTILDLRRPSGASAFDVDVRAVVEAAAGSGCALLFGERPGRHGFGWRDARSAVTAGAILALCPDVAGPAAVVALRYPVALARKAWVTSANVLNTLEPASFPRPPTA